MTHVSYAGPITLLDLLTHAAGFSYGFLGDCGVAFAYREQGLELPCRLTAHVDRDPSVPPVADLREFVSRLNAIPLAAHPGERFQYSVATDVLGRVVEAVSEMPLGEYFRTRIFANAGMSDTSFTLDRSEIGRLSACHASGEVCEGRRSLRFADCTEVLPHDGVGDLEYDRCGWREDNALCPSGGGGLLSTTDDMVRFAEALRTDQLLSQTSAAEMRRDHLAPRGVRKESLAQGYEGFGLGVWTTTTTQAQRSEASSSGKAAASPVLAIAPAALGAGGWGGAAGTGLLVDPKHGLSVIITTQLLGYHLVAPTFRADLFRAAYNLFPDLATHEPPPACDEPSHVGFSG